MKAPKLNDGPEGHPGSAAVFLRLDRLVRATSAPPLPYRRTSVTVPERRTSMSSRRGALQSGAAGLSRAKRLCGRLGRTLQAPIPQREPTFIVRAAGASCADSFARLKPAAPRLAANGQLQHPPGENALSPSHSTPS
jgi:hypothetical protein